MKRTCPSAEAIAVPAPFADQDFPALGPFMGRVNAAEFLGKPPGTVMFVGPEGKSSRPVAKLNFVRVVTRVTRATDTCCRNSAAHFVTTIWQVK